MFRPHLDAIDSQRDRMLARVIEWSGVNSGTFNLAGLATMRAKLESTFAHLGGGAPPDIRRVPLPPAKSIDSSGNETETPLGEMLLITKRPDAPLRVLLGIHYDTVFGPAHAFQH